MQELSAEQRIYAERRRRRLMLTIATVTAVLLHGVLGFAGGRLRSAAEEIGLKSLIDVIVKKPPPKPEPKPKPKPKKKKRKKVDLRKKRRPKPTKQPKVPPPEPPKPIFGVTMNSTSKTGAGVTLRVGNTLMKAPEKAFTKPGDVRPYEPVAGHKLNRYPRLISSERARLERLPYPEQARDEEIEGRVILLLDINYLGKVVRARVLKDPGAGLGAAAVKALRNARFEPAIMDGEAVDARLHYQYDFVLEG